MGHLVAGVDPTKGDVNIDANDQPRDRLTWEFYRGAKPDLAARGHWYFGFHSGDPGQQRGLEFREDVEAGYPNTTTQTFTCCDHGRNFSENTWPAIPHATQLVITPWYRGGFLWVVGNIYLPRRGGRANDLVHLVLPPPQPGDALFVSWSDVARWPPNEG